MFRFLLLATLLPALAVSDRFNIIPCPGINLPTHFDIPECVNGSPCDFHIGQTITLEISFQSAGEVTQIPTLAEITRANGEVHNFPLPTGDACNAVVGGCPIGAGHHTVRFPVTVAGILPDEQVTITVTMRDQNNLGLACGSIIAQFHPTN
uniref:Protein involved in innate immunity and lipid metabolism n=1 Tax=Lutzomyia longipalpis TaxID=7200 RepID=A0A1B0CC77_LUTLO